MKVFDLLDVAGLPDLGPPGQIIKVVRLTSLVYTDA
jgi:hypothetical protein